MKTRHRFSAVILSFTVVTLSFTAVILSLPPSVLSSTAVILSFTAVIFSFTAVILSFTAVILSFTAVILSGAKNPRISHFLETRAMELRHIRYFCAVADSGTFSKAAQKLHISQSAISEQIADLEEEIGGPLLDRTQRRARLTPQGELFLAEARKTLLAAERAIDITRRSLKGEVGTLAIGFFPWGAGGFFARIIREYRKLYPQVRLSLYEMHTWLQMDALLSGKIDVGFTRPLEPPFDRSLRAELLYSDPIVVAMPIDHPLASQSVSISALATEPFVLCERDSTPTLFDAIIGLCTRAGYSPQIVNSSSTWSGVLTLVESGEGVAMVPSGARHLRSPGVTFATIEPETTHIGISVAWNPENEGPIQRDFLKLVLANKERIRESGGY